MDSLQHIALLVDADNTQLSKLEGVIREVSKYGRIVVKRAYGNWKKDTLKKWEGEIQRLAIKAEQQFDYVSGKNTTDIALVIDAMNLMHRELYDGFVIVSSDSDFTPLAIHLHESGVYVMGVGVRSTPESFKNSCDEFILLENIDAPESADAPEAKQPDETKIAQTGQTRSAAPEQKNAGKTGAIDEIHHLLRLAWESYQNDDGFAYISAAGLYIRRVKPDFDVRTFSFKKLTDLLEAFPKRYEMRPSEASPSIKLYRCLKTGRT